MRRADRDGGRVSDQQPRLPVRVRLTAPEKRRVWRVGLLPAAVVALVLWPFVARGSASGLDLAGAVVVYGGLTGAALAVMAFDRAQARHCPSCGAPPDVAGEGECRVCDYDLRTRPRFVCEDRHRVHLSPGECECGQPLRPLVADGGGDRFVRRTVVFGGWLLALLVTLGVLFRPGVG